MVTVKVVAEQGKFQTVLSYDSGFTFVGEQFEAGQPVEGRFDGERRAEADATDWRQKLTKAGLEVA